jgi:hypothetical protein
MREALMRAPDGSPEGVLTHVGAGPSGTDYLYPINAPPVPGGWETPEFDDSQWPRTFLNPAHLIFARNAENVAISACFVVEIEDSIEGVFETVTRTALIQKAGGGTGFAFDSLRPTGDLVASSGGVTSGPISFWRVFAETTNAIQQGAQRRGANMGMMAVEHPDVLYRPVKPAFHPVRG